MVSLSQPTLAVTGIKSGVKWPKVRTIRRGNAIVPKGSTRSSEFTIEVVGLDTLTEHFAAIAAATGPLAYNIVNFYGQAVKENARRWVPIDTQATHDSIHTGDAGGGGPEGGPTPDGPPIIVGDGWSIDIGPTTYYARWVEFGTVMMSPQPFMIPAITVAEPEFWQSMEGLAKLADQWNDLGKAGQDSSVRGILSQLRGSMYTVAKAMGDVNAFVGRNIFGGYRSLLYRSARGIGDVNSIMRQTLGTRISRRMSGRVTGHLAGFGSATLSHGATYSAFPGGAGGHRLYNRIAGRALAGGAGFGLGGMSSGGSIGLTTLGGLG